MILFLATDGGESVTSGIPSTIKGFKKKKKSPSSVWSDSDDDDDDGDHEEEEDDHVCAVPVKLTDCWCKQ